MSFVTRSDWASAEELIKILEEADQLIPDELREMKSRFDAMKERKEKEKESFGGSGGGSRRYLTISILLFFCSNLNLIWSNSILMNVFSTIVVDMVPAEEADLGLAEAAEEDAGNGNLGRIIQFVPCWKSKSEANASISNIYTKKLNLSRTVIDTVIIMIDNNHTLTIESKILQSIFLLIYYSTEATHHQN